MATNLLIRKLPREVDNVLEAYKQRHDIKVNTDAACDIIIRHPMMLKEIEALTKKNNELQRRIHKLEYAIQGYLNRKKEAQDYLNLLNELTHEE